MSRRLLPLVLLLLICITTRTQAQNYLSESFDGATYPPTGWDTTALSGTGASARSFEWERVASTGGSTPAPSSHSGAYMVNYNSHFIALGGQAELITPPMNFSAYTPGTNQVSFWMFRYKGNSRVDVYVNTTPTSTSATLLGTVHNDVTFSPVESAVGWHQYTYTIPASFSSSATVYVIFQSTSSYNYDINIDDVTADHIPPSPTITGSTKFCEGTTISLSASDSESSTTIYWTGPGGFTDTGASISIPNASSSNAGTYKAYATAGGDTSAASSIDITVPQLPVTTLSTNSPICSGSDLNINTSVPTLDTIRFKWVGPNGFTTTDQNVTITSATFAASGDYYVYDTSGDGCTYTDTISVVVDSTPHIDTVIGITPTTCSASNGSLQILRFLPLTTYSVTYTKNDTSKSINDTLTSDINGIITITGLTTGSYNNISVVNTFGEGCVSNTYTGPIILNAVGAPAPPSLSNSGPVCTNTTLTLFSSGVPTGGTIHWYGPSSFTSTSANPPISNVTAANGGTYYAYVVDTSGCPSLPDSTTAVIKPLPDEPSASSNSPVCEGDTINLTATCTTSGVTYNWTGPNSFASTTQNPSIGNATLNANGTYRVYSVLNGCISADTATTDVVVNWIPGSPTASSNSPVCSGTGNVLSFTGYDSSSSPLTYHWYGPNSYTSSSQNPTISSPSTSDSGTYYLYVTRKGCYSDTTNTQVVIYPTPAPPTPTPSSTTYCQYDSTMTLSATGSKLLWYMVSSGGSGSAAAPKPSSAIAGTYNWWVTQTSNEGCESQRAKTTVIVNAKPMPPYLGADSMYTYCQGDNPSRLRATGVDLLWYTSATGGTGDPVAPMPSTASYGDFYYYVTQTVNGCESDRARVHILVKQKPAAPSVSVVTYCQGDVATPLSAGGANLLWYTVPSGGIGSPVAPTPLTSYADTIHYFVTQTVNGCESDRAELLVVVNYTPNAVIVASQPFVCQFDTMSFKYYGNGKADATYNWTMPTGASMVSGIGQGPIVVRFDSFGHKDVMLLVDNKGCKSPLTKYTVDVRQAPDVAIKMSGDVCQGQTLDISLGYPNEKIDGYKWDFDNGNIVYGSNGSGPYGIEWDIAGPKYVKLVAYSSECHSRDIIDTVQVHPLADAHIQSVSNNNICAGDTVVFTAERYNPAYLYQWLPASYFTNSTNQEEVKGLIGQSGYIKLRVTTEYGCVSTDSTLIKAQPCCEMYFPNAFTPNGDGKNDIFRPIVRGNQQMKTFRVINRWGQVMFETTDQHMGWNGKYNGVPQDMGTYYYYVEYTCANGKVYKDKGEVILIR